MHDERLVLGFQSVRECLRARGNEVHKVLLEASHSAELDAVGRFATSKGVPIARLSRGELDRMARGVRHQGVIALAPPLRVGKLEDLIGAEFRSVVALDEIEDPQNFGAIVRSSVALGAGAVLWPEHHAAPLSPAMVRASAGAVEHARLIRVASLPHALEELRSHGATVFGLDMNGEAIDSVTKASPCVIVVGAEGKGLRKQVKTQCDALVRIAMPGPIASLNASVAAAIALFALGRPAPQ